MFKAKKSKCLAAVSILLCSVVLFSNTAFAVGTEAAILAADDSEMKVVNPVTATGSSLDVTIGNEYKIDPNVTKAAKDFMVQDGKSGELTDPIPLYNLNNKVECICYKIDTGGFATVDVNNYHVIDYSPDGLSEAHYYLSIHNDRPKFYTNGPLNTFYETEDGELAGISFNGQFEKSNFVDIYAQKPEPYKKIHLAEAVTSHNIPGETKAWSNGTQGSWDFYWCGPVAIAILLEYYQRMIAPYNGERYCPIQWVGQTKTRVDWCYFLTKQLDNGSRYICNDPLYMYQVPNGRDSGDEHAYLGLNTYLSWVCSTSKQFQYSLYNWYTMQNQINNDEPFLLQIEHGTDIEIPEGDAHMVVVVGYKMASTNQKYFIINDGWWHTKRQVEIRAGTMPCFVYMS